jgi:hypothetical protein
MKSGAVHARLAGGYAQAYLRIEKDWQYGLAGRDTVPSAFSIAALQRKSRPYRTILPANPWPITCLESSRVLVHHCPDGMCPKIVNRAHVLSLHERVKNIGNFRPLKKTIFYKHQSWSSWFHVHKRDSGINIIMRQEKVEWAVANEDEQTAFAALAESKQQVTQIEDSVKTITAPLKRKYCAIGLNAQKLSPLYSNLNENPGRKRSKTSRPRRQKRHNIRIPGSSIAYLELCRIDFRKSSLVISSFQFQEMVIDKSMDRSITPSLGK